MYLPLWFYWLLVGALSLTALQWAVYLARGKEPKLTPLPIRFLEQVAVIVALLLLAS